MEHLSQVKAFTLTLIAETGERFSDFTPYVASVNNAGQVAFQAALRDGGMGLFTGNGGPIITVTDTTHGLWNSFYSHPDINRHGALSVYASRPTGDQGVLLATEGQLLTLAETGDLFKSIGPLGPTMNDEGTVAFRAELKSGDSGIFTGRNGSLSTIADTRSRFSGFQGLPVINRQGSVAFRADLKEGGQGIYTGNGESLITIADTGNLFSDLALFPSINAEGTVAFGATRQSAGAGIFTVTDGQLTTVIEPNGLFESVRSALINHSGAIVFAATPKGQDLGIYCGPDPGADRLLALGDPMLGSTVASFALNPVSVNDAGQVAIRVKLADDRQAIIRADPVKAPGQRPYWEETGIC